MRTPNLADNNDDIIHAIVANKEVGKVLDAMLREYQVRCMHPEALHRIRRETQSRVEDTPPQNPTRKGQVYKITWCRRCHKVLKSEPDNGPQQ